MTRTMARHRVPIGTAMDCPLGVDPWNNEVTSKVNIADKLPLSLFLEGQNGRYPSTSKSYGRDKHKVTTFHLSVIPCPVSLSPSVILSIGTSFLSLPARWVPSSAHRPPSQQRKQSSQETA